MSSKDVLLNVLSKYLGEPTHKKEDNNAFHCPFCNHHKKKLEVDLSTGLWNCWVCHTKGKGVSFLLRKINAPFNDIQNIKKYESYNSKKSDYNNDFIFLPDYYVAFDVNVSNFVQDRLINYLSTRGVSYDDIRKYKLGYSSKDPNNIIIPSYDRNFKINYYVEKNISTGRYVNPNYSKNQIIFESFVDWSSDIVIVEGVFDAMSVQRNAVPLLGKILGTQLKESLLRSAVNNVYIALDSGETKDIMKISEYLLSIGKKVFIVDLPEGEDPSSIGKDRIWDYIGSARPTNIDAIFLHKLNL